MKIPCHTFGALRGLTLHVDLEVEAPTLRFNTPEIDFGLQAVRKSATRQLTFTNDSPVPVTFRFLEVSRGQRRCAHARPKAGSAGVEHARTESCC